jgi:hypothetical protein
LARSSAWVRAQRSASSSRLACAAAHSSASGVAPSLRCASSRCTPARKAATRCAALSVLARRGSLATVGVAFEGLGIGGLGRRWIGDC